jgi:hypothetical protein
MVTGQMQVAAPCQDKSVFQEIRNSGTLSRHQGITVSLGDRVRAIPIDAADFEIFSKKGVTDRGRFRSAFQTGR